jgi:hypothetical protein
MIPFADAMGDSALAMICIPLPFVAAGLLLVPHEMVKDFTISTNIEFLKQPKKVEKVCWDNRVSGRLVYSVASVFSGLLV